MIQQHRGPEVNSISDSNTTHTGKQRATVTTTRATSGRNNTRKSRRLFQQYLLHGQVFFGALLSFYLQTVKIIIKTNGEAYGIPVTISPAEINISGMSSDEYRIMLVYINIVAQAATPLDGEFRRKKCLH